MNIDDRRTTNDRPHVFGKFQMAIILQRVIRSTSCMHGHYTFALVYHCLHIWRKIGDLLHKGWQLDQLRCEKNVMRDQLWINRREKNTRGLYNTIDWSQSKVFLVTFYITFWYASAIEDIFVQLLIFVLLHFGSICNCSSQQLITSY